MKERTLPQRVLGSVPLEDGKKIHSLFGYYPLNLFTVLFITSKTKTLFIDLYLLDPVQVVSPPFLL